MPKKSLVVVFVAAVAALLYAFGSHTAFDDAPTDAAGRVPAAGAPDGSPDDPYAVLANGRTTLTQAAYEGDTRHLKRLMRLETPVNLSRPDANGDNVLVAAIAGGHFDLARRLMQVGAMVDRAAVKRYSQTLDPLQDKEAINWMLIYGLPFADPQILRTLYSPDDHSEDSLMLAAGYRPTREEAQAMLADGLNNTGYAPLYRLYPELFSTEDKLRVFNPIRYATATASERALVEIIFPTLPYKDSRRFDDIVDKLPYEVAATHPDYARFGPAHFDDYCDTDDESAVLLLDQGVPCRSEHPFYRATQAGNYTLVQRIINTTPDAATERLYGKSIMTHLLDEHSAGSLEMAKLLMDNGAATAAERATFYRAIDAFGNRFDHYRDYPRTPLKLWASPQDDLYVLAYDRDEKRYHLSRQDAEGKLVWDQVLEGERFFNVLDHPVGLYGVDGGLLLVEDRFLDGRRKVRLSRVDGGDGHVIVRHDVPGHFESLVLDEAGPALTTSRRAVLLDPQLAPKGDIASDPEAFLPAVSMEAAKAHSRHKGFYHDLRKLDDYPDRKLLLYRTNMFVESYEPVPELSQYLALIVSKDGETSVSAVLGGGGITPLDFALSEKHAYVIESLPDEVAIQKRSAEFAVPSYHYLAFDEASPFSARVDSLACDATGCSAVGEGADKLVLLRTVPGERVQRRVRTDARARRDDSDAPEISWHVVRDGTRDFVSGEHELRFDALHTSGDGEWILLDHTRGLLPGAEGRLYAFGSHEGDAAYEVLDGDGVLQAHHQFDFGYADSRINAMRRLPDGRLLIVGRVFAHYRFFRTFAALLDANGTPVWRRVYDDMAHMRGLLVDAPAGTFYTLDGAESMARISLQDGTVIKRLPVAAGLERLVRSADGVIVGIGKVEQRYGSGRRDTTHQPLLYCLSADGAAQTHVVGTPGDRIDAVAPWQDGIVAAYALDKDGSATTNMVLGLIHPDTCEITFDWKL